MHQFIRCR